MSKISQKRVSQKRIQELISAYGAGTDRWPDAERQAGQAWLAGNRGKAQKLLADAQALDLLLDRAPAPASDTSLLQARILKAAQNTAQDGIPAVIAANDGASISANPNLLASWKSVAATLVLTISIGVGTGFGIGQAAAADTRYASAEALLSISMQSDYDETDLFGEAP